MVKELPIVGWREWVSLPELGVDRVKAKVDTGARTSSLHAWDVRIDDSVDPPLVRFEVHPIQRSIRETVTCSAPLVERRWVRSSNGKRERRPVIETAVKIGDEIFTIEVTLTSRDLMGFRMLIGRQAIRRRFLVHAGRSFVTTRRKKTKVRDRKSERRDG